MQKTHTHIELLVASLMHRYNTTLSDVVTIQGDLGREPAEVGGNRNVVFFSFYSLINAKY